MKKKNVDVKKSVRVSTKGKGSKSRGGQAVRSSIKVSRNNEVVKSVQKLHNSILKDYRTTLKSAIQIGKILTKVKKELGHSNWLPWVKKYLPFSSHTATNYMNIYNYQDEIKKENVSNLNEAYHLLVNIKNHHDTITRKRTKNYRKKFADKKSDFKNPKKGNYENQVIAGDNYDVMKEMLKQGMKNQYSGVVTSPPYNASFHYSDTFNDNKPYNEFLKETLKPFPLYPKLLRKGGRVIYIIGNVVKKNNENDNGDYTHQVIDDLKTGVKKVAPKLRFFNHIIWDKSVRPNPLN